MKHHSLILSVSLGLAAARAVAQTPTPTSNPWFSGDVTVVPYVAPPPPSGEPAPAPVPPNIFLGDAQGLTGNEWIFEAGANNATARSTSFINLNGGNWRWMRSNATTAAPNAVYSPMTLSAYGTLTLTSTYSPSSQIVLDPTSKQLTVWGANVLTSSGSNNYGVSDRFFFGNYLLPDGTGQTVLGRYNAAVPWDSANPGNNPLFVVGGGANGARSNALVLRANGDAAFGGKLTTSAAAVGTGLSIGGAAQTVLGRYNASVGWEAANPARDPLLIVGGGSSVDAPSNALVLRANGDAAFLGKLTAGAFTFAQGDYATAIGFDSSAYGLGAVALGMHSHASAPHAVVIGRSSFAQDAYAVAIGGYNYATKYAATSFGAGCAASGMWSFAAGLESRAGGYYAVAMGDHCVASGTGSQAFGSSTASADYATAIGVSRATAPYSTAIGRGSLAEGTSQTVVGKFNAQSLNALFVVGNGADLPGVRSNAFEVRGDGVAHARVVRVAESGDLSMGDFKNGPEPFAQ